MKKNQQDCLRSGAGNDDIMRFHSHPPRWWDSWKQHPEGNSFCRRRIWAQPGCTVVVLTELPDNEGMSVSNAFERLAAMTLNEFPQFAPLPEIVWVEHYAPYRASGGHENETLDLAFPNLNRGEKLWQSTNCTWRFLWALTDFVSSSPLPPARQALLDWLRGFPDLLTTPAAIYAEFLPSDLTTPVPLR